MSSQDRRARDRERMRERILEAARDMFIRKGYEATTMRAIAARVEYAPTVIYSHFQNKDALLTELCGNDFRALVAAFRKIGVVTDPIERLARMGEVYVEFAIAHPMQYKLMFMTPRPPLEDAGPADNPGTECFGMLLETCADVVATGRLRPELEDPQMLAEIAWGTLHGIVSLHIVKGDHGNIDWRDPLETGRNAVATLVRGMTKET